MKNISEQIKMVAYFPCIKENFKYLKVNKHVKDSCELLNKDKYQKLKNHLHDDYLSRVD